MLPLDKFYSRNKHRCKECLRKQVKAHWDAKGPLYLSRQKPSDPVKNKARGLLRLAVKHGRVTRPGACEACRIDCKPDAHHADYARPLDVKWLCRQCHAALEERQRRARDFDPATVKPLLFVACIPSGALLN